MPGRTSGHVAYGYFSAPEKSLFLAVIGIDFFKIGIDHVVVFGLLLIAAGRTGIGAARAFGLARLIHG